MPIRRFSPLTRFLFLILILLPLALLAACGEAATPSPTATLPAQDPTPTATPTHFERARCLEGPELISGPFCSRFEAVMRFTPMEFADKPIVFADYESARVTRGHPEARGYDGFFSEHFSTRQDERERIYEGVPMHPNFSAMVKTFKEQVSLDILATDLSLWSHESGNQARTFLLMDGSWDREQIGVKLLEIGYQEDSYKDVPYYRLHPDYNVSPQPPLHRYALPVNRIAFMGDWLLAAPATEIVEDMIDVTMNEATNLYDSQPHQAIAEALYEGVLARSFVTPQWVTEEWHGMNIDAIQRVNPYIDGPDKWGNLSAYSTAFVGIRQREGNDEMVVAIYYPDEEAAAKDAPVLEERWQSFRFIQNIGRSEGSVLETPTPALWNPDMTDVTKACAPLSTFVVQLDDASVLVATCRVIRSEDDPFLARGAHLWYWLYSNRWLEILAPDIQELKQIAESNWEG